MYMCLCVCVVVVVAVDDVVFDVDFCVCVFFSFFLVHVDCFTLSIIHRTLTWTSRSLTCVCDLIACVYKRGISVYSRRGGGRGC